MNSRFLAGLLCIFMILALTPLGVVEAGGNSAVVQRDSILDLSSTSGTYMSTDGTEKTVDFTNTSINDSAEGWSWDADSKTLTLSGAQIKGSPVSGKPNESAGIYMSNDSTLNIILKAGTSSKVEAGSIESDSYAFSVGILIFFGTINISGSGELEAVAGSAQAGGTFRPYSLGIYTSQINISGDAKVIAKGGDSVGHSTVDCSGIRGSLEVKDNALVEATGGEAISDATSGGAYIESHGVNTDTGTFKMFGNARIVAKGGKITDTVGGNLSFCSGVKSKYIVIEGNSELEATGGTALGSLSIGLSALAESGTSISISGNAKVTARGGPGQYRSCGIYDRGGGSISISDNAVVTAIGGVRAPDTFNTNFSSIGIYGKNITIKGGEVTAKGDAEDEKMVALNIVTNGKVLISPDTTINMKIAVEVGDDITSKAAITGSAFTEDTYITDLIQNKAYFHSEARTAIVATPGTLDFGSVYTGYSQPQAMTVTIKNQENQTVTLMNTASDTGDYIISGLSKTSLDAGEEAIFTVQPKANLGWGTYSDTITITGDNDAVAAVSLSFTVEEKTIAAGVNSDDAVTIWYGKNGDEPIAWRVIGTAKEGVASTSGDITLLSKDSLGSTPFIYEHNNHYSPSLLKAAIDNIVNYFSVKERATITPRYLAVEEYKENEPYSDGIAGNPVINANFWPLSTFEAKALNDSIRDIGKVWWLRSPGGGPKVCAFVNTNGALVRGGADRASDYGIRPAFYLKEDSIVFTSAAVGGKASATIGQDALKKLPATAPDELKLTIFDSEHDNLGVSVELFDGKQASFSYTGATINNAVTAPNEYISALVKNEMGEITYYGKIVRPDNVSGSAIINLPSNFDSVKDKLYVFAEQANDDKMTDYAGELIQLSLNAHAISYVLTGLTAEGPSYYLHNETEDYTAILTAATGYNLPQIITIKVGETVLGQEDYAYDNSTGELSIPSGKISASVTITATASKISSGSSGGGSGGSGGTVVPPAPTEEAVSISGGSEEVPLTVDVSGDTANVNPLGEAELQQILEAAGAANGAVAIDLSTMDDLIDTVIIPDGLVTGVVQSAGRGLEITMPDGKSVSFDETAMATLAAAGSGDLKLVVRKLDEEALTESERRLVGSNAIVIDLTAHIGEKQVSDFGGGLVTVSIPVVGQPVEHPIVWRMTTDADGNVRLEAIECTYNSETKCYEFRTASFSEYVLGNYPFTDTPDSAWYYENAVFAYVNGFFSGTTETTFSPNVAMTRGMLVAVLWRMEGSPDLSQSAGSSKASDFTDVASGIYYADAVAWASANGIVSGYGNGSFGPNDKISREQLAAILHRYAQYKGYDVSVGEDTNILSYNDAFDIAEYAISALQWACSAGLVQGSNGNLMPQGDATRAQVAAVLHRFTVR